MPAFVPEPDVADAEAAALRRHFLLDPDIVFLNHGSFGATPRPVLRAQQRWRWRMERNPVAFLGRESALHLRQARERLAVVLGARAEDLAFMTNATTALNGVAASLPLGEGDEVLITDHEYGACVAAWRRHAQRCGAVVRVADLPWPWDARQAEAALLAQAGERTRVLFFSHVTSTTALEMPAAAWCRAARERGWISVVDGAHAPGQIPLALDTLGADFYIGNLHKWICAPKGAAFLHVRGPWQAPLQPQVVSWGALAEEAARLAHDQHLTGARPVVDDGSGASPATAGHTGFAAYTGDTTLEMRLLWQGTRDPSAFLAVPAALDFLHAHDWPRRQAACRQALADLQQQVEGLTGLAAPCAAGRSRLQMAALPVRVAPASAEALRRWLFERHRIEVPVTTHRDQVFVRVSLQAYNRASDRQALRTALEEAAR